MPDFVTHFVKFESNKDIAAQALLRIIESGELRGGTGYIMGGHTCICFSDKPVGSNFPGLFDMYGTQKIYARFGISIPKINLYKKGGRPVIYQDISEYNNLPDTHKWRHVTYKPYQPSRVDFTWEREWRIQINHLNLKEVKASIVIPESRRGEFDYQFDQITQNNPNAYIPRIFSFS